jgi:uncharacterized protein YbaP (TraB family)
MPVRFCTLAASALLLAGCSAPARAAPAMWVVRDADSTLYLLGTVHLLRPDVVWNTPKIAEAFAGCRDLTLELADGDGSTAMGPLVQRYGFDPAHPLSARLSPAERARLAAAAAAMGMDPAALESMRPWLAGLTLSLAPLVRAGYAPDSGVEKLLTEQARAAGHPVLGLETTEQQVRLLAELPEDAQLDLVRDALDDFDKAPTELDQMADAWARGDLETLDRLVNDDVRRDSPALYRAVLADRNKAFARQIKAMLDDSAGSRCIAVGAGHLVGKDSVQAELVRLGVRSERY